MCFFYSGCSQPPNQFPSCQHSKDTAGSPFPHFSVCFLVSQFFTSVCFLLVSFSGQFFSCSLHGRVVERSEWVWSGC